MRTHRFAVVALLIAASGCATGPSFREPVRSEPHAVLKFSTATGLKETVFTAQQLIPLELNGLPPSTMKATFREFRAPPGDVKLLMQAAGVGRLVAVCSLAFKAEAGKEYLFRTVNSDESLTIQVFETEDAILASCEGKKQLAPQSTTIPIFIPS